MKYEGGFYFDLMGIFDQEITCPPDIGITNKFQFLVTGSHVYGPATINSDLDIVMQIHDAHEFKEALTKKGLDVHQTLEQIGYEEGFYFDLMGIKVNVILVYDREEFDAWEFATNKMKKESSIADRKQRIKAFQNFLNHYRYSDGL